MNRELGFRAWHPMLKCFIYFNKLEMIHASKYELSAAESIETSGGRHVYHCWHEEAPIQQYTGLKDKNGKKIFEGDIVKFSYYLHDHEIETIVGEVFFEDGIYYFDRDLLMATNDGNFIDESLEVVGNKFENPEL